MKVQQQIHPSLGLQHLTTATATATATSTAMAPARASTRRGRSGGASLRESVQSTYSVHSYSASVPSHVSHIPHISSSIFSSAPLPPTYAITLAHTGYPTEAEKEAARTAGTEFVSDAATAAVVSLVALPRRAFRAQLVGSVATADWLTATFAFPCTCELGFLGEADSRLVG